MSAEAGGRHASNWPGLRPVSGPPGEQGSCTTPGCPGDYRYAPPGRGHVEGCRYVTGDDDGEGSG